VKGKHDGVSMSRIKTAVPSSFTVAQFESELERRQREIERLRARLKEEGIDPDRSE